MQKIHLTTLTPENNVFKVIYLDSTEYNEDYKVSKRFSDLSQTIIKVNNYLCEYFVEYARELKWDIRACNKTT